MANGLSYSLFGRRLDALESMSTMTEDHAEGSLDRRRAGLLAHISSLPGPGACGDMGPAAYRLVEFLQAAGISVWQTLPIGPTQSDGSPYQSSSMHAGNPRFIALEPLIDQGWLPADILQQQPFNNAAKALLLRRAWREFQRQGHQELEQELQQFIERERFWLEDYALFRALHEESGTAWWQWRAELRDREPGALHKATARLSDILNYIRFEQFQFFRQWLALKAYANQRGILLFGDMPIFVAHDSAEVWAHRDMFVLDPEGMPEIVAGVPPDYFSATGQRWGNPLYRWENMEQDGFSFWIQRMRTQLHLFDLIRIDHFRGFEAYWAVPAYEEYAINGSWVKAPGDALFSRLHDIYDPLPLVAEDLGVITPEVDTLRRKYGLPGMKILQFAFSGGADNPYLPFRQEANSVVYTGTHDNDTSLGWYLSLDDEGRRYVDEFLGLSKEIMPWPLIRSVLASRSKLAVVPLQDLLGLNGEHRMNLPGTIEGNWLWRFEWDQVEPDLAQRVRRRIEMYGRLV